MAISEETLQKLLEVLKSSDRSNIRDLLTDDVKRGILEDKNQLRKVMSQVGDNDFSEFIFAIDADMLAAVVVKDLTVLDSIKHTSQKANIIHNLFKNPASKTYLLENIDQLQKLLGKIPRWLLALPFNMDEELSLAIVKDITLLSSMDVTNSTNLIKNLVTNPVVKSYLLKDENKVQLQNLLMQVPSENTWSIIEAMGEELLLAIARDFNLLSVIKIDHGAQTRLFDKRRPNRVITPPFEAVDAYYISVKAGHILGLSEAIALKTATGGSKLKVEGNVTERSLAWMNNFLEKYINSEHLKEQPESAYFKQIKEAMHFSAQRMIKSTSLYDIYADEELHNRFHGDKDNPGKLIYIASGWSGHTVGIAMYGDHLIYCNRGEGLLDKMHGTQIFKIKDKTKITPEFINKLMSKSNNNPEELHMTLNEVVDLNQPVVTFSSKEQEHGNCDFANPKATIEAMLVLCAMHASGYKDDVHLKKEATTYEKRIFYKDFTRFIRDEEIKEIIKYANQANTPEMEGFFVELIKTIILEHHGRSANRSDSKKGEEIQRAKTLLQGIPQHMRRTIENAMGETALLNMPLKIVEEPEQIQKDPKKRQSLLFVASKESSKEDKTVSNAAKKQQKTLAHKVDRKNPPGTTRA